jgi:hypothetical protein
LGYNKSMENKGVPLLNVPRLASRHPQWNLPTMTGRSSAEGRFVYAFARAYAREQGTLHRGSLRKALKLAREVRVNGYGIADLVGVVWDDRLNVEPSADAPVTLRAFEVKIGRWRQAMLQAHRYRFYAHVAYVVVPQHEIRSVLPFLETFRKIHVGLWGYDAYTDRIKPVYSPRPCAPLRPKHHVEAIEQVCLTPTVRQAKRTSLQLLQCRLDIHRGLPGLP